MCNEHLISEHPLTSFWTHHRALRVTLRNRLRHHPMSLTPTSPACVWAGPMAWDGHRCVLSVTLMTWWLFFHHCNVVQPGWLPPVTFSAIECYNGIQWPYKLPAGRCQHQGHMRVWIQTGSPSIIQNMGSLNASKTFNNHLINYHVNPGWINMNKT